MSVQRHREDNVGYIVISNAPVNAIDQGVRRGLLEAVLWAEKEQLERVILSGCGGIFAAGADVRELEHEPTEPYLPDVLKAIEDSVIPWIAAIEGVALGGGAELALACRMRIMAAQARIGLPEVTLGIVPGAGGTKRLPRLVGVKLSIDVITSGRQLPAEEALAIGFIHAIDDEPSYAAYMVNSEQLGCIVPACDLPVPVKEPALLASAREQMLSNYPGQQAPIRAIDLIEAGLDVSFSEGQKIERQAFLDLRASDQAKALRHIFFAERKARSSSEIITKPNTSSHIAMVGICDNLVGNRLLARYREAADTVLMDGSTPWEIDEAMVEFGYTLGPYAAQDISGLDIAHASRQRQVANRDPARRYIPIADRMIELGKLGRKTGAGWYRYPGGNGRVEDPIVADLALEEAHFAGITRVEYTAVEIRERLLFAVINEATMLLHEGIATCASDINLITVFGYDFPRWRGGLLHYADTLGAKLIVEQLQQFSKEDPVAWKISPLLRHCADSDSLISAA